MTSQIQLNLDPHLQAKWHTQVEGKFQGTVKSQRSGWFPSGWDDPLTH